MASQASRGALRRRGRHKARQLGPWLARTRHAEDCPQLHWKLPRWWLRHRLRPSPQGVAATTRRALAVTHGVPSTATTPSGATTPSIADTADTPSTPNTVGSLPPRQEPGMAPYRGLQHLGCWCLPRLRRRIVLDAGVDTARQCQSPTRRLLRGKPRQRQRRMRPSARRRQTRKLLSAWQPATRRWRTLRRRRPQRRRRSWRLCARLVWRRKRSDRSRWRRRRLARRRCG